MNLIKAKLSKRFVVIFIMVLCFLVAFLWTTRETLPIKQKPLPSAFKPRVVDKQGDVVIFENESYSIVYQPIFSQYLITILSSDFSETKNQAELKFLETTQLTKITACQKKVIVNTTVSINPAFAGKDYPLSYCTKPSPPPDLTLNPNLPPLQIVKTYPEGGVVTNGGTSNGVYVAFSDVVELNSASIIIEPQLSFTIRTHPNKPTELIIVPQSKWETGKTYTITIKAGLKSLNGLSQLKADHLISYQITPVPTPFEPNEKGI